MSDGADTVVVIDDDFSAREGLDSLLRSVGLAVRLHGSVAEFLAAGRPDAPTCLVLDVRLPGQGGLEFQRVLAAEGSPPPIVFITGHGDIPMSVQAMKAGAVEFLTKPFRDQELIDAIQLGLGRDRARRRDEAAMADLRGRYASLSDREREVMGLAVSGLMNKQIAAELALSEITVKVHRGAAMRKMHVRTFADLVRAAEKLKAVSLA